jgi:hypothetical protein
VFPKIISVPVLIKDAGNIAFTVADVPTGIKEGVWIFPFAVVIIPVLASLQAFLIAKEIDILL